MSVTQPETSGGVQKGPRRRKMNEIAEVGPTSPGERPIRLPCPRSDPAQTGPIQSHLDTNFSLQALLSKSISSFSQGSEEVNRPSA
jgi:hypothetical protein